MPFAWSCLEKLTGVVGGLSVLALAGSADPTGILGTTVAASGLVAWWRERVQVHGPESDAALKRIRKAVEKTFEDQSHDWSQDEAVRRADEFLDRHLLDCTLRREEVARSAVSLRGFPGGAADLVMDALLRVGDLRDAGEHPLRDPRGAGAAFARAVVEAAFTAALDDRDYFARLHPYLLAEIGQGIGRVEAKLDQGFVRVEAMFAEVMRSVQVPLPALRDAAARFAAIRDDAQPQDILDHLHRFADDYHRLKRQFDALETDDDEAATLQAAARDALGRGDLEGARAALEEADALLDRREADAAWNRVLSLRARAEAELLALEWRSADRLWRDAAERAERIGRPAAWEMRLEAAAALGSFGERLGQAEAIAAAVSAWRRLADTSFTPMQAALVRLHLARSLQTLGEHAAAADAMDLFAESAELHRAILADDADDAMPWARAEAHNGLGSALLLMGERSAGNAGTSLLEGALAQFGHAKAAYAGDGFGRAAAAHNSGNVLQELGHRTGGDIGLALLRQAADAYREALEARTREGSLDDRAATLNSLSNVLQILGERTPGAEGLAMLDAAIKGFREVLTIYDPQQRPTSRARSLSNLGNALAARGELTEGPAGSALLGEAVGAFREALSLPTPRMDAAGIRTNLANALCAWAERHDGGARMERLIAAEAECRAALDVRSPEATPLGWAATMANLGEVLLAMSRHAPGSAGVDLSRQAASALEAALEVFDEGGFSAHHAKVAASLDAAKTALAERERTAATLH